MRESRAEAATTPCWCLGVDRPRLGKDRIWNGICLVPLEIVFSGVDALRETGERALRPSGLAKGRIQALRCPTFFFPPPFFAIVLVRCRDATAHAWRRPVFTQRVKEGIETRVLKTNPRGPGPAFGRPDGTRKKFPGQAVRGVRPEDAPTDPMRREDGVRLASARLPLCETCDVTCVAQSAVGDERNFPGNCREPNGDGTWEPGEKQKVPCTGALRERTYSTVQYTGRVSDGFWSGLLQYHTSIIRINRNMHNEHHHSPTPQGVLSNCYE